jgi:transcriptional regulator with XRE-family HTH domain
MMAEMLLGDIRKEAGFTQEQAAELLGIKQPSLSKLESQDDMQISTLRKIVRALGGDVERIVRRLLRDGSFFDQRFRQSNRRIGRFV